MTKADLTVIIATFIYIQSFFVAKTMKVRDWWNLVSPASCFKWTTAANWVREVFWQNSARVSLYSSNLKKMPARVTCYWLCQPIRPVSSGCITQFSQRQVLSLSSGCMNLVRSYIPSISKAQYRLLHVLSSTLDLILCSMLFHLINGRIRVMTLFKENHLMGSYIK